MSYFYNNLCRMCGKRNKAPQNESIKVVKVKIDETKYNLVLYDGKTMPFPTEEFLEETEGLKPSHTNLFINLKNQQSLEDFKGMWSCYEHSEPQIRLPSPEKKIVISKPKIPRLKILLYFETDAGPYFLEPLKSLLYKVADVTTSTVKQGFEADASQYHIIYTIVFQCGRIPYEQKNRIDAIDQRYKDKHLLLVFKKNDCQIETLRLEDTNRSFVKLCESRKVNERNTVVIEEEASASLPGFFENHILEAAKYVKIEEDSKERFNNHQSIQIFDECQLQNSPAYGSKDDFKRTNKNDMSIEGRYYK